MKKKILLLAGLMMAFALNSYAEGPSYAKQATEMMNRDFQPRGIVKLDQLKQDFTVETCTRYRGLPPTPLARLIEKDQLATIQYPADGQYMGDWKRGEKIAQSGRGMTWSDKVDTVNGGGCYGCHRLSGTELAYGSIGPSLYQFGKLRGGPTEANQKYVYGKIYNSEAYAACSNMPRFGYHGILTEAQIKDLVALVLDPASPVNQ